MASRVRAIGDRYRSDNVGPTAQTKLPYVVTKYYPPTGRDVRIAQTSQQRFHEAETNRENSYSRSGTVERVISESSVAKVESPLSFPTFYRDTPEPRELDESELKETEEQAKFKRMQVLYKKVRKANHALKGKADALKEQLASLRGKVNTLKKQNERLNRLLQSQDSYFKREIDGLISNYRKEVEALNLQCNSLKLENHMMSKKITKMEGKDTKIR